MCCCKCSDLWADHCKACYCVRCDRLGKRSVCEKSVNCIFSIIFPTCLMKLACICCAYCDCTTGFECYCPSTYFGFGLVCPNIPGCCGIVRMTPEGRKWWLKKKPFKPCSRDKDAEETDEEDGKGAKAKDKEGKAYSKQAGRDAGGGGPSGDNPFRADDGAGPKLTIHDGGSKPVGKMTKKEKKAAAKAAESAAGQVKASEWNALAKANDRY